MTCVDVHWLGRLVLLVQQHIRLCSEHLPLGGGAGVSVGSVEPLLPWQLSVGDIVTRVDLPEMYQYGPECVSRCRPEGGGGQALPVQCHAVGLLTHHALQWASSSRKGNTTWSSFLLGYQPLSHVTRCRCTHRLRGN